MRYSKRYLKSAPTCCLIYKYLKPINNKYLNTRTTRVGSSHNKGIEQVCHIITPSIQNGTLLEPLIFYLYINSLISSVNYHLRNIRRISKFLDQDTKHAVVRSFILSRLDYGNALLYGAKSKDLDCLQSLQHKAIKLIFSANRFDSPAPLMNTLHWLPIRERINFKICMYVFKCIHGNAPKYLSDFISHRLRPVTGPITRSSNDSTLIVAHVGRNCIGDKSFYVTAPRLWNALPRNIREAKSLTVFKKMLKSHLCPKY